MTRHLLAGLTILLVSCAGVGTTELPPDVGEVMPGYMVGYLADDERPNSAAILPPPPAPGSAAHARDEEASRATFELRGGARWDLAIADADLLFPAAASHFEDVIGFRVSREETPWLYRVLRRTLADGGLSSEAAKKKYQRPRPFMVNGEPMGHPEDEEGYRKDGSYPSGHTSAGFTWALVLVELVPERAEAIVARGLEFGESRMVINVHWQSDVDAGRIMGAATFARLQADEEFRHDMEMAKLEVARVRSKP